MSLTLKVKTKHAEQIVTDLSSEATVEQLVDKLTTITGIQANRLSILMGFPPKKLDLADRSKTLQTCGIGNGIKLIVDELAAPVEEPKPTAVESSSVAATVHESIDNGFSAGILLKKVVPSDNSCLFTSIG